MTLKNITLLGLLPMLCGHAAAVTTVVNDNFNNSNLATVGAGDVGSGHQVFNNGTKNVTETTTARFTQGTAVADWIRTELHSNDEVPVAALLATNSSVRFSWTVSNINTLRTLVGGTGAEYRIQLGILPAAAEQGLGAEMYVNTAGGIWFDMNILGSNTMGADINLHDSPGKAANGDAPIRTSLADPTGWDWATTPRTFTLTLTATDYNWSDSAGTNYGGATYAAAGFGAPLLSQSFWGFHMSQDRANEGKGGHDLLNFSVVAIPEAGSMVLLGLTAAGALVRRRRP